MMMCFELHNLTRLRYQTKKKRKEKRKDAIRLATMFVETVPLVLLALNDDWAQIVLALLVVGTVRSVTVRPILGLPAAAEGGLLANVLDVDHVHDLGLRRPDRAVHLGARLGAGLRAERQVGHVDEAAEGGGRWDEREPVLEAKPEPSAEGVRNRQPGQIVGKGGLDQAGQGLHRNTAF